MAKIFIPHNVTRFDKATERRIPAFDYSSAANYGKLVTILPDSADLLQTQNRMNDIQEFLRMHMEQGDYLLPVGDPSIIALCSAVMADLFGEIKLLKFDKKLQQYLPLEAIL